ncbi:ABC transporter permease [Rhizobium sp. P40RR-XXII]|uniref:ABC transporter permease n=1 Tax=unclassified Rhizobium TaxID=2613769 RepID=UPI00145749BB|nr:MULTISPECIES: ABC transporter permease [unclassified Rhizobium]NLR85415.1 ABC transporter permease [Rhizobium sp. P28RR-XV]NLS20073.1 ABC transporter permease [Rhizobium sp. P40RR-XXII]
MTRFLLGRLGQSFILLFVISLIGFCVLMLAPGGPMSKFALTPGISKADLDRIAHQMGLDRPILIQYLDWLWGLVRGDWGRSFRDGRPVLTIIGEHLFATLLLMGSSTAIAIGLGTWIGMKSAIKRYSIFDHTMTIGTMIALSIPTFWFGLVAIYIFALDLGWFPAGNMYTVGNETALDYLHHLVLPSAVLALVNVAIWSRYMRSSMLEAIGQEFVNTARAKGVPERIVMRRHVARNAMLPMITLAGMQLPQLLGGALVAETVFTWPGMGRLFLDSLGYSDYPVIMGLLMFSAILTVVGSLLADLLTAFIDPRIRLA